jgi:hypothetical protein
VKATIGRHDVRMSTSPATKQYSPIVEDSIYQRDISLLDGGGCYVETKGWYDAYLAFRDLQRENTIDRIDKEQKNLPQTTVINHPNKPMDWPSLASAVDRDAPQHQRTYRIDMNAENPVGYDRTGPIEHRIGLFHERTHIAADQSYSINDQEALGDTFHRQPNVDDAVTFRAAYGAIEKRLDKLSAIVKNDRSLSSQQQTEILSRLRYAGQAREYDPVINELLMYTRDYGIEANSDTTKALRTLAEENLKHRQTPGSKLSSKSSI